MLSHANLKVYVFRWWWWFRPRAYILVPAFILLIVATQTLIAYLHYSGILTPIIATTSTSTIAQADTNRLTTASTPAASQLNDPINSYDPQQHVAIAIPVGGRTERSQMLDQMLEVLIEGGALPENIFVFEDVLSRWNQQLSEPVAKVAKARGVSVVASRVDRSKGEDANNFGIGLARHYHFFLDYLLADSSTANVVQLAPRGPYDFAVVIEDDLALSPDLVKFFFSMSRVMQADDTLYCAAAHQDNAFLGIHRDDSFDSAVHRQTSLSSDQFDFRRGNHFMAPGWMTSRRIYTQVVRPKWMDAALEYSHKGELHLRNGHWDRFFDSMIGERDCVFPELPRITHQGADGFTVSKRGQMELYSNLRLAQLPVTVNYGDLSRLTKAGYIAETEQFIRSAKRLNVLEEIRDFRHAKLVYVLPASDDKDDQWNAPFNHFFGLIGVGGYGGYEGYVKVRGIFRGAVFVRWLTNLVLLVGEYSPYMAVVKQMERVEDGLEIRRVGCYKDAWERDLPYQVLHYTSQTNTPRRCLASCNALGFRYAGLQKAECWCGNSYGSKGAADDDSACSMECTAVARGLLSNLLTSAEKKAAADKQEPKQCGSGFMNTVYENVHPETKDRHTKALVAPAGVKYLKAEAGESCDDACARVGGEYGRCDERYFPLIHRSCAALQSVFGSAECAACVDEEDPERGFATPALWMCTVRKCLMSRGRYNRCNWQPPSGLIRACTCVQ